MNKLDSGVYKIECVENGKVYIGSSIELSKRIYHHKCQLNAGKHHSRHLQNAWNRYGADAFNISVIVRCQPQDCLKQEQRLIDAHDACNQERGFNSAPVAGSCYGTTRSKEARLRMSRAQREARKKYEWKGEKLCLSDIAESEGVDVGLLISRVVGMGRSVADAVSKDRRVGKYMLEHNGATKPISEIAVDIGIHPRRLHYWIKDRGLTIEQCIDRLEKEKKKISLREFCKVFGISDATVKSRLQSGLCLMDSLHEPGPTGVRYQEEAAQ